MAIPGRYQTGDAGDQDGLILTDLRSPMLTELFGSMAFRAIMLAVGEEIRTRYVASVPRDSGNLASTAKVTAHRSKTHEDRRWEAEFSVGGPGAPYAGIIEAEQHVLANVLRDMGFRTGDLVSGPTGTIRKEEAEPRVTLYHRTRRPDVADAIVRDGFRPTFGENAASAAYIEMNQGYGFFTKGVDDQAGYGSEILSVQVPASVVEDDPWSGHFRVPVDKLQGMQFQRYEEDD